MRIAIIETPFLESHVRKTLADIRIPADVDYYNYDSFASIGRLYASLCRDYDGFLTSGPLPLSAIKRYVGELPRPVVSFGSDAIGYYETFFRVQYEQNDMDFEKGYFDLLDMQPKRFSLRDALREGSFWKRMLACYEYTSRLSMREFASLEERIAKKHIALYLNGNTVYSVTRLSSIMPRLLSAGVPVYFIYPSLHILQNAVNELISRIHIENMLQAQRAYIHTELGAETKLPQESQVPDPELPPELKLSAGSGLSPKMMRRVMCAVEEIGSCRITSRMLAQSMDLNVRSANRLLARLVSAGLARIVSEQMLKGRGRPERVYLVLEDYM